MDLQSQVLAFLKSQKLAVIATNSADGAPESALVGVAVTPQLELVFDTVCTTRKAINLRRDPRISAVIGLADEETLQMEGVADEPIGHDLNQVRDIYFQAYPDGRERLNWVGITHFRVHPTWICFTSYLDPKRSVELRFG